VKGADVAPPTPSVVITGAAGGIGSALARRFGDAGCHLALLDVDPAGVSAVADQLRERAPSVLPLACDITSAEQCADAMRRIGDTHGGIDVLINNAGLTHLGLLRDTDVAVLRKVMDVNFFGAVHCTKAALPSLLERRGQLIVISSVAGFAPLATRCGYAASKHALHGFFDSLRAEHERDGLRVLLVCPSFVDTAIGAHALGADGRRATADTRTGVRGAIAPEQVADAVFTASRSGRRILFVPWQARAYYWISRLSPHLFARLMARRTLA